MKDDISLSTDAQIPEPQRLSKGGILLTSIYLLLCIISSSPIIFSIDDTKPDKYYFLIILTLPWSYFGGIFFRLISNAFADTNLFYGSWYAPTWRTHLFFYIIIATSVFLNSFFLFFIGEKLEELLRKLLSCLPSISKQ